MPLKALGAQSVSTFSTLSTIYFEHSIANVKTKEWQFKSGRNLKLPLRITTLTESVSRYNWQWKQEYLSLLIVKLQL